MKKTILICTILIFLGFVSGFYVGKYYSLNNTLPSIADNVEKNLGWLVGEQAALRTVRAFEAYFHEPSNVGIWALKSTIADFEELLKLDIGGPIYDKKTIYTDLMIAYARLSNLYTKSGMTELANMHTKKALECALLASPDSNRLDNIQRINSFIDKMDKRYYEIKKQSNTSAAPDALKAARP